MKPVKKSKSPKISEKWDRDTYQQVGSLLEDINSKIRVFGEHQALTNERFERKLDVVIKEVGTIKEDITTLKGDVYELKEGQKRMEERQTRMEKDISEISSEIRLIKIEIAELKLSLFQKADLEKLAQLEKRVLKIEKAIGN